MKTTGHSPVWDDARIIYWGMSPSISGNAANHSGECSLAFRECLKDSGECRQKFRGLLQNILGNVLKHSLLLKNDVVIFHSQR